MRARESAQGNFDATPSGFIVRRDAMRWFLSILQTAVSEFNTRVHIALNYFSLTASAAHTTWATFLFHHAEWWLPPRKMIFPLHFSKLNSAKHTHERTRRRPSFHLQADSPFEWALSPRTPKEKIALLVFLLISCELFIAEWFRNEKKQQILKHYHESLGF